MPCSNSAENTINQFYFIIKYVKFYLLLKGYLSMHRILFSLSILFISYPAYAYLDPGSIGLFIQGLIAGILGIVGVFAYQWQRVKLFFSKFFNKKK